MSFWKFNLSKTQMEQLVKSSFFKKFKAIASLPFVHILDFVFKNFSGNPVNLHMGI